MEFDRLSHILWHGVTRQEVWSLLNTSQQGLSGEEALKRQDLFGPNELPKAQRKSVLTVYFHQFISPLIYLLCAAALVSILIGEVTDALFIFAVLQINAIIGTIQEWKAQKSAESLNAMVKNRVVVLRDGKRIEIDSAQLVPGDYAFLESGALIPADIRLIQSLEARADESLLTGESVTVNKGALEAIGEESAIGDRHNMLHAGTTLSQGRCEGIVTQIGLHTELGRIAQALQTTENAAPPLVQRLDKFTRSIGFLVVLAVVILGATMVWQGVSVKEVFFLAVALSVSAIPEGLPVAITVALSISSFHMSKRNVIVRALPAVEGLGACTVIASDKTGTLTVNELTVRRLWLAEGPELEVSGEGYSPKGEVDFKAARLAVAASLCNEATFRLEKEGYHHFGDAVDVAFLVMAAKAGLDRESLLERHPEHGFLPFESERKFSASINHFDDEALVSLKGAAEVIAPLCSNIKSEDILKRAEEMASQGYRVLALAQGSWSEDHELDALSGRKDLTFLGLAGLIDPLRPEAFDAIKKCACAGVGVRMVTGDHPATALALAKELGIAHEKSDVVTGAELKDLQDDPINLAETIHSARVFARVEPVQKLNIVQSLQENNHFVAVTGDGVNDAPALRSANIGVAMGKEGTDVARGAADLIITDDNFASIVNGVEEGRIAYANVRKVIYLLVSTGASEIVLFFLCLISGMPLPLFAVQLLWLNLVTNGVQHVGLSLEKGEGDELHDPPRNPKMPIFNRRMIEEVVISGLFIGIVAYLFFQYALANGFDEASARSSLLLLMVLFENTHVFNCRSERKSLFKMPLLRNPILVMMVILTQAIHIGAAYVPGLNTTLNIQPVSLDQWLTLLPLALGLIVVMEIYKWLRR
ncbi:Cation-transporting ATPase [Candidatus Terasakiella magnetica]|uniref:Cation-transporting ATPase n=1 Tax=Candidatus Terasakiella magnetica TaxID=1867952 RepID=A0A1C3RGV4_9PROT|nr:HAD-IC family P-type ATPase [Candidatus Terasakiella magnetica]SCA56500.1 Cation-transporting ATPase [Candidatus Terasakiella magnetica]